MIIPGAVGPSSQEYSPFFNDERSVNWMPVENPEGKQQTALYPTPGLSMFTSGGTGPGRGSFAAANGRSFYVSGSGLYETTSAGVSTLLGSLTSSAGNVNIDENGFQLAVCDGTSLYIFTYATNAFAKVTDPDFPTSVGTVTFIDGYFAVNQNSSGKFYISALYDGLTWNSLDFATAESSPDNLLRVINVLGQLWLLGAKTSEIWTNTGASSFPFERISGGKIETGILAPLTSLAIDNSIIWVGRDNIGAGIVYRAQGFTPQRISTSPIELKIQAAPSPSTLISFTYQEQGRTFYFLTGGGMNTSLICDLANGLWHERAFLNTFGNYETHRASSCMYAFSKQLVTDKDNGNVYEMSLNYYSDAGEEITRDRIFTHISEENRRFKNSSLTLDFQVGVGLQTGQGSDPLCTLGLSNDSGLTFFGNYQKSLGKVGKYLTRVVFNRLGQSRTRTYRVRITEPVKVVLIGAYLNARG